MDRKTTHLPILAMINPPVVTEGSAPLDEAVLQVSVKPAVTGRLNRPMQSSGEKEMFRGRDVPAGAPVYATELGGRLVWCAPGFNNGVWLSGTRTYCAVKSGTSWMSTATREGPFVTRASVMLDIGTIDPPSVSLEPVAFSETFRIGYFVSHWTEGRAVIQRQILWSGRPYPYGCSLDAPRNADGSADLIAFGSTYRLAPEADGRSTHIAFVGPASAAAQRSFEGSGDCPASRITGGYSTTTYMQRVSYPRHR